MDLELVRLVTIHPALVHVTIGVMPVVLVGYLVGARRRSPSWTFAADVALWVGAIVTVAAAAFGLVSNFRLFWPVDLDTYRWIHLVLGALATLAVGGLAVARWRRRTSVASANWVVAALAVAGLVGATGWVGGDVLVFHAGMAVKGGVSGALAPPLARDRATEHPRDFRDVMGRLRSHLASVEAQVATMIVDHPSDVRYRVITSESLAIGQLARWLADHPHALSDLDARQSPERQPVAGKHATDNDDAANSPEIEQANYADLLSQSAERLRDAASAHDLQALAVEAGRTAGACAACHASVRWKPR